MLGPEASAVLLGLAVLSSADLWPGRPARRFLSSRAHNVMVSIFGLAGAFAQLRWLSVARATRACFAIRFRRRPWPAKDISGLRDALTLRHLHGSGEDCTSAEEQRSPWRRRFHHATMYGFLLCFASTSVAALYHIVFGWRAPYGYASLPVVLGTLGGAGLLIGPAGLLAARRRRDPALGDPAQDGPDESFILMLFMTSATGLLLLALRGQPVMAPLLIVHLGFVLGLFLTLPYGKFVHGIYRTVALMVHAQERR